MTLVIRSIDRHVDTSRGRLRVNSFGYAFAYGVAAGEPVRIGHSSETIPTGDVVLYDMAVSAWRELTDWEQSYVEFRELSHEDKISRIADDPVHAQYVVGMH